MKGFSCSSFKQSILMVFFIYQCRSSYCRNSHRSLKEDGLTRNNGFSPPLRIFGSDFVGKYGSRHHRAWSGLVQYLFPVDCYSIQVIKIIERSSELEIRIFLSFRLPRCSCKKSFFEQRHRNSLFHNRPELLAATYPTCTHSVSGWNCHQCTRRCLIGMESNWSG